VAALLSALGNRFETRCSLATASSAKSGSPAGQLRVAEERSRSSCGGDQAITQRTQVTGGPDTEERVDVLEKQVGFPPPPTRLCHSAKDTCA
jgi:hypothetical protein